MKNFKKVLALVLAVATLLSFATVAGAYTDVNFGDDYAEAIEVLSAVGVLEGNTGYDGAFRPKDTLTREEAAKLIAIFDNGSTDIADLYTSTNPFADVIGRWSASYVGYCYRAGIVVGPRANMFDPKANVTGTQFLKMALTVLDYDAEKEGLVGASWDVNTIKLANDIELTAGLAEGWLPEKDLTRGEAAQIMYNALCSDTVEYGSAIRYFAEDLPDVDLTTGKPRLVTVAGAYPTGHYLFEGWGLDVNVKTDAFNRPYTVWTNAAGSVIAKVMFPVAAEYTSTVTGCQILADLGVAKTNVTKKLIYQFYNNGRYEKKNVANLTTDFGTVAGVDCLKHSAAINGEHDCYAKDVTFGHQGTLTQVFYMPATNTYRITTIDTWLAKVAAATPVTSSKDGHKLGTANLELNVYNSNNNVTAHGDDNEYCIEHCLGWTETTSEPGSLKKNDYVLITATKRGTGHVVDWNEIGVFAGETIGNDNVGAVVKSAVKTEAVAGKLTGFIKDLADDAYGYTTTRVDYAEKPDSFHFHLGYAASKDTDNVGKTKAFFYDTYGNVIGMTDAATTLEYLVVDKAWGYWNNGDSGLKADVVFLDASKKNVEVANLQGVPTKNIAKIEVLPDWVYGTDWFDIEDYRAYKPAYGTLMTYTVDANGAYVLVGAGANKPEIEVDVFINKGNPNLWKGVAGVHGYIPTNEKTQYLLKNPDGSYVAYTGFEEIPSCCLSYCEWIIPTGGTYASIVYGEVAYYAADSALAFITKPEKTDELTFEGNPTKYYKYEGYVNGEKTAIYSENANLFGIESAEDVAGKIGLYKLTFKTDKYGVLVCLSRSENKLDGTKSGTVVSCDVNSLVLNGMAAIAIKDKPIYVYQAKTNTVVAGTVADMVKDREVYLYTAGAELASNGSNVKAIFVYDTSY